MGTFRLLRYAAQDWQYMAIGAVASGIIGLQVAVLLSTGPACAPTLLMQMRVITNVCWQSILTCVALHAVPRHGSGSLEYYQCVLQHRPRAHPPRGAPSLISHCASAALAMNQYLATPAMTFAAQRPVLLSDVMVTKACTIAKHTLIAAHITAGPGVVAGVRCNRRRLYHCHHRSAGTQRISQIMAVPAY